MYAYLWLFFTTTANTTAITAAVTTTTASTTRTTAIIINIKMMAFSTIHNFLSFAVGRCIINSMRSVVTKSGVCAEHVCDAYVCVAMRFDTNGNIQNAFPAANSYSTRIPHNFSIIHFLLLMSSSSSSSSSARRGNCCWLANICYLDPVFIRIVCNEFNT